MKSIKEILTAISNIVMELSILNFQSMLVCQKLGFNGFKRWHKYYSKDYYDLVMCLEMKAFDYYSTTLDATSDVKSYDAKSIIYHFQSFKDLADKHLADLGTLNKEFVELTGFEAPKMCDIKCLLMKQIEKCNRMVYRYKSIGSEATGLHDIHVYDDELHKKMKQKEADYYARDRQLSK